jgi:UDP-N-acetylmuramoyl-L-alanyl-D-glutamate--2,6-diaminopimelate ligase
LRLSELIEPRDGAAMIGADVAIRGLSADSRRIEPGFLFAALDGTKARGRDFIGDALRRGAAALLTGPDVMPPLEAQHLPRVTDRNPRRRLAFMAAHFYRLQPSVIAAVTGTNGKSSVAGLTRQLWALCGKAAGSLGTLGVEAPGVALDLGHTTPDPVALHAALAEMAHRGIDHLALEASSHGLDQNRLDGVRIRAAAFTNLSRDHFDYHADADAYFAAKLRLFDTLLPDGGVAVLNADVPQYEALLRVCRARHQRILSYGAKGDDIRLLSSTPTESGQSLALDVLGARRTIELGLPGAFQALNLIAALGLVLGTGTPLDEALLALSRVAPVRGRLEAVRGHPRGALVYVDYAHTPDALETVLRALRPYARTRLIALFGCGGDRDRGKRPTMGAIARRLADRAYVTDDNPRSEDPAAIRREILAACPSAREIGDRARAIRCALAELGPGDVLLIAGKGHERGQIVGSRTLPFDDAQVARQAIAELSRGAA